MESFISIALCTQLNQDRNRTIHFTFIHNLFITQYPSLHQSESEDCVKLWTYLQKLSVYVMMEFSRLSLKKGLSSRKKLGCFITLIDSLYLQESVVQRKNFWKKILHPKKGQKP